MNRKLILLCLLLYLPYLIKAQDYKGIWHGYITEYNYEITSGYVLQVKEHKGNVISGRAYIYSKQYFLFQGLLDFIGTIEKENSKVTELVIVKSEMPTNNALLCIKFLNLAFSKKFNKETLTGNWNGYSSHNQCRPGEVYLQRYSFTDSTQADPIPAPIEKMIKEDINPKMTFLSTTLTQPIIINVTKSLLTLEIEDYLKEDSDTVSVYFNRVPILSNLAIRKKAYKKTVRLDKLSGLNEVVIYAENLGKIPPNTCVLTVNDGLTKQKVNIFSSKQSSAVIYLNYTPTPRKQIPPYGYRSDEENKFNNELQKSKAGPTKLK